MTKRNGWKTLFLRWLPGIIISALIIFILVSLVNPQELGNALKKINIEVILLASFLMIVSIMARAEGWRSFLENRINFRDAFFILNEGYLLNNILPRSGEIGRALLLGATSDLSAIQVFSTIVIERAFDLIIAAVMFLSTIPFVFTFDWLKPIATALLIIVLLGLILLFFVAYKKRAVKIWVKKLSEKNKLVRKWVFPHIYALLEGLQVLTNPKQLFIGVGWIIVSWSLWTVLFYWLITIFVGDVAFWWALFSQSVLSMGIALPSAPANLGMYEGAIVAALSVFNVSRSAALSVALISHAVQILITSSFGLFGLVMQRQSLGNLLKIIRLRIIKSKNEENV